jgi:hypothetical protein
MFLFLLNSLLVFFLKHAFFNRFHLTLTVNWLYFNFVLSLKHFAKALSFKEVFCCIFLFLVFRFILKSGCSSLIPFYNKLAKVDTTVKKYYSKILDLFNAFFQIVCKAKMNFIFLQKKVRQVVLLCTLVVGISNSMHGQISENFQQWLPKASYAAALSQNGVGGTWTALANAVIVAPNGSANGTGSSGFVQIASGFNYALMLPNISSGGVGTVSIQARASSASGASFTVDKNVNGGGWSTIATFSSVTDTGTLYQAIVNDASANIQLRITNSSLNRALYIHDVSTTTTTTTPCNYGSITGTSGSSVNHVVISQIYGGGGLAASTGPPPVSAAIYKNDFVELFNPTNASISLNDYSLQYASASGVDWGKVNLLGTIASGGYFLIQLFSDTAGFGVSLPTPDFVPSSNAINMANDSGKIALINNQNTITSGISYPPQVSIIDFVGYGVANSAEANAAAPQLTRILANFRNGLGGQDTDVNATDFTAKTPNPRNSATLPQANQSFCVSGTPNVMTVNGASGSGSFLYQWYSRSGIVAAPVGASTAGWTSLGTSNGANTNIYTPPAVITSSTTYACFVTPSGTPTCGSGGWASGVRQITVTPLIGFVNLQFPASGSICANGTYDVFGQIYVAGITEVPFAGPGIVAELGFSTSNTNPSTWTNWTASTFNTQVGNNDEYKATLSGLSAGTYYYAFRYSLNGCPYKYGGKNGIWNNDSGVLTVYGLPSAAIAGTNQTICNKSMLTLTANSPIVGTGQWSISSGPNLNTAQFSNVSSNSSGFTPINNGSYTLAWTISNGLCTPSTATVQIIVNNTDWVNLQSPQSGSICANGTYNVFGQIYAEGITNSGGAGPSIIAELGYSTSNTNPSTWTNWTASTFNTQVGNNDEYKATLSGLSAGTYYYAFRYSLTGCPYKYGGINGIWNNDSGVLTVYGIPTTATAGPDQTVCEGTAITLAANTPTVGSGQWSIISGSGGSITTIASPTSIFTGVINTTYTLRWTTSNGTCANTSDDVVIRINGINWANTQWPPNASICSNGSLPVFGQIFVAGLTEPTGAGAGIVAELGYSATNTHPSTWINWIPAEINQTPLLTNNNDEYMSTLSGLPAGTYYYAFRYSLNGCRPYKYGGNNWDGSTSVTGGFWDGTNNISGVLTVNQPTVAISGITTICSGSSTTLTASGANTYLWSNGSTATSITVSPTNLTTYTVTGTDSNNCTNTANINITVNPKPISTLIYHD